MLNIAQLAHRKKIAENHALAFQSDTSKDEKCIIKIDLYLRMEWLRKQIK